MGRLRELAGRATFLDHKGGCASCPRKKIDLVPPTLRGAPFIAVGEAPGAEEVKQKEGFVGRSGQLLRGIFRRVGIDQFDLSNTIKCRPPNNRTPTDKEISCCMRQFTMEEVKGYPLVLLLGAVPTRAFFKSFSGKKLRGNFAYHPDYPGQRFLATYHPAYALRVPEIEEVIEKHVGRLAREIADPRPKITVYTPTHPEFDTRFRACINAPKFCWDVETNGKKSWAPDARSTAFALAIEDNWAVSVHEDDPCYIACAEAVAEALRQPEKQVIGYNVGFDIEWWEREFRFVSLARYIYDVQWLYYQLKGYKEMSLKELTSREGDGYRHLVPWPHLPHWDAQHLSWYGGEDVCHTLKLLRQGVPQLHPLTRDLFIRVGGPISLTTRRIQAAGVYVHTDHWEQTALKTKKAKEEIIKAWAIDDPDFNPENFRNEKGEISPTGKALTEYLYTTKGLPVINKTAKKGEPQTDDATVKIFIRDHGATYLRHLVEWKVLDKRENTFISPVPKLIEEDGRIHPSFLTTTTDTFRLSSRNPNFQNQPRSRDIRWMYGARPGWWFGEGDLSQIELRIAVSLANDTFAIAEYNRGVDLHMRTARIITGKEHPSGEERTTAKSVNFALVYGGGAEGLVQYAWNEYGIILSLEDARKFVHLFFHEIVPALPAWHNATRQELFANKGHALNAAGHYKYYEGWDSPHDADREHIVRSHLNSKCQGPAAVLLNYILILTQQRIMEMKLPAVITGTVHDSVHWESDPEVFDEVVHLFQASVVKVAAWASSWFKVPLVMDFKRGNCEIPDGQTWGTLKDYKPAA